jgi:hypothetical protein
MPRGTVIVLIELRERTRTLVRVTLRVAVSDGAKAEEGRTVARREANAHSVGVRGPPETHNPDAGAVALGDGTKQRMNFCEGSEQMRRMDDAGRLHPHLYPYSPATGHTRKAQDLNLRMELPATLWNIGACRAGKMASDMSTSHVIFSVESNLLGF